MITQLTAKRGAQPALDAHRAPLTLYWVFWLFLIAGVAGDLVEIVFWLVTRGELTSRSSLIYGQFSIVWGAGAVLLTLVFHRMDSRSTPRVFLAGTLLGGVYEYVCSLLQEKLFGACFWDYRHLPFNLNGRVNLVFCLFWGGGGGAVGAGGVSRAVPLRGPDSPGAGPADRRGSRRLPGAQHRRHRRRPGPHGPPPGGGACPGGRQPLPGRRLPQSLPPCPLPQYGHTQRDRVVRLDGKSLPPCGRGNVRKLPLPQFL